MSKDSDSKSEPEDLANEAMEEIARERELDQQQTEKEKRPISGANQGFILGVVSFVFLFLTVLNLVGHMPFQVITPPVSEDELRYNLRSALNFAVRQVDSYLLINGQLPESLVEIGGPDNPAWNFEVMEDGQYRIEIERDNVQVAFDSTDDPNVVFADLRVP